MTDHTGLDPLGEIVQSLYGINSEQQASVYAAGGIFIVVTGSLLSIGVPDASDAAITATVAAAAKATRRIRQVGKAGSRYWKVGDDCIKGEDQVADLFSSRGFEVFHAAHDKVLEALPDIRINGTWWEVKTPELTTPFHKAVKNSFVNTARQHKRHGNRSRLILNFMDREGATVNETIKSLNRIVIGHPNYKTQVREVMIITPHRDPFIVQTWRLGR